AGSQQGRPGIGHTLLLRRAVRARLAQRAHVPSSFSAARYGFALPSIRNPTLGRTMKKAALIVSGLLVSALVCGSVVAEPVRVRLTARVTDVSDPQGHLNGKIVPGQRMNGTYVYNTNTPNRWP